MLKYNCWIICHNCPSFDVNIPRFLEMSLLKKKATLVLLDYANIGNGKIWHLVHFIQESHRTGKSGKTWEKKGVRESKGKLRNFFFVADYREIKKCDFHLKNVMIIISCSR